MAAIVSVEEFECPTCSGEIVAYCYEHGHQDEAVQTRRGMTCAEWRYEDGKMCRQALDLICRQCKRAVKL